MNWPSLASLFCDLVDRPAFAVDIEGRVQMYNTAMERLCEYERAEVLGRRWGERCSAFSGPRLSTLIGLDVHQAEIRCRTKSGQRVELDVDLMPFGDPATPEGFAAVVTAVRRPRMPSVSAGIPERRIEIETEGERFGTILADFDPRGSGGTVGQRCFDVIGKHAQRCLQCPIATSAKVGERIVRTISMAGVGEAVVSAVRTSATTAEVSYQLVPEAQLSELVRARIANLAARHGLSEREREVLDLLLLGRSLDEIGVVLSISARTVKFHQFNLLAKLGVESRLDLLRLLL